MCWTIVAHAEKIEITADHLSIKNKENIAIFKDNVVMKKDDLLIYSPILKVIYDQKNQKQNKLKEIIADKGIKVMSYDKKLIADHAKYDVTNDIIIFTGNAKYIQGDNTVSGEKIIYNIQNEEVRILNNPAKQVTVSIEH